MLVILVNFFNECNTYSYIKMSNSITETSLKNSSALIYIAMWGIFFKDMTLLLTIHAIQ